MNVVSIYVVPLDHHGLAAHGVQVGPQICDLNGWPDIFNETERWRKELCEIGWKWCDCYLLARVFMSAIGQQENLDLSEAEYLAAAL